MIQPAVRKGRGKMVAKQELTRFWDTTGFGGDLPGIPEFLAGDQFAPPRSGASGELFRRGWPPKSVGT